MIAGGTIDRATVERIVRQIVFARTAAHGAEPASSGRRRAGGQHFRSALPFDRRTRADAVWSRRDADAA